MNSTETTTIRRHVEAVTRMLLAGRAMKVGVAITGGDPLDRAGVQNLAEMATLSCTDVLHLECATGKDGRPVMTGITVVVARDRICYAQTGCCLWLPRTGDRALLLPQPTSRGHFRLSPRELIHVDGKPADLDGGVRRAEARLAKLVARGGCKPGQVSITELSSAA